jgi:hypothetical protein
MFRFVLDIMLLQRLGVIGIILVLIYSLYQKNVPWMLKNRQQVWQWHTCGLQLAPCIDFLAWRTEWKYPSVHTVGSATVFRG